jgi:hypothetical protein
MKNGLNLYYLKIRGKPFSSSFLLRGKTQNITVFASKNQTIFTLSRNDNDTATALIPLLYVALSIRRFLLSSMTVEN